MLYEYGNMGKGTFKNGYFPKLLIVYKTHNWHETDQISS